MKMYNADSLVEKLKAEVIKLYMRGHVAAEHHVQEHAMKIVYAEPTVDAVPVVRCRDCKYWSGQNDEPGEVTAIGYCNHINHHIMPLMPDWYCSDGAKMDLKEE